MEDEKLLALLKKKPEMGIETLIQQYGRLVASIVRNRMSGCQKEDIEECVSDVFVSFYEGIHRMDLQKGSLRAYLSVIARRRGADYYKRCYKNSSVPLLEEMPDREDAFVQKEQRMELCSYLESLPEIDRKIILWKYYFGYSARQIANCLQIKENTVDKRAQRALEKLRAVGKGGEVYEGAGLDRNDG